MNSQARKKPRSIYYRGQKDSGVGLQCQGSLSAVSTCLFSRKTSTSCHMLTIPHKQLPIFPYLVAIGCNPRTPVRKIPKRSEAYSQINMQKGEAYTAPQTYTHLPTINGTEPSRNFGTRFVRKQKSQRHGRICSTVQGLLPLPSTKQIIVLLMFTIWGNLSNVGEEYYQH